MQIVLFKHLTTEENLLEIEKQAEKYVGFHMEMEDKQQRKIVKDSASVINTMLKKIERARIDLNAERKKELEAECSAIVIRLKKANEPFTILIEDYKVKRSAQLSEIKKIEDEKDAALQFEEDHENAITLDKIRTFEAKELIEEQKARDEKISKEASAKAEQEKEAAEERAEQAEKDTILAEAKAKRDAEQAEKDRIEAKERAESSRIEAERLHNIRESEAAEKAKQTEVQRQADEKSKIEAEKAKLEANKSHVGSVRREIKEHLMSLCKIDDALAVKIVKALLKIERVKINY